MCPILLQFFPDWNFGADLDSEPGSLQEFQDWNLFWEKRCQRWGIWVGGTCALWVKNSHIPQPGVG